jgi:hypothetical protein
MGYAMLSGRLPFEGESFRDVIVQHVTQEPAPLAALVPEVPPDLAAAVMRCLAKEPGRRWADAHALRLAIEEEVAEDDEFLRGFRRSLNRGFIGAVVFGLVGLLAVCAWAAFPVVRRIMLGRLILLAFVGGPLFLFGALRGARREGHSRDEIRSLFFKPPRWWPFWWPPSWRARGDVWNRLPPVLRSVRLGRLMALVFGYTMVLTIMVGAALGERGLHGWVGIVYSALAVGQIAAIPVLLAGASWRLTRWGRSRGIDDLDGEWLGSRPTGDLAFWRRPEFAAQLLPPPGRAAAARPAEPRSPEEYAQAIRDLVGQLPSGTQATVSEAADAARQLLGTVAALDAELAKLAQDADPQESEAVEAKLRALGPEAADEGEMRREKRVLLVHQRALLRRLDERVKELTERRSRLDDLMRTMWLQVATLRAEAAHDTLAVTEISGRIKALCTEIDAHVQAAETVRAETG